MKLQMFSFLLLLIANTALAANKQPLRVEDIMHFRSIESPQLSKDGAWLTYTSKPDRGDSSAVLISIDGKHRYRWQTSSKPVISSDGQWAYRVTEPALLLREQDDEKKKKEGNNSNNGSKLENGMALIKLADKSEMLFDHVALGQFSDDARWFIKLHTPDYKPESKKPSSDLTEKPKESVVEEAPKNKKDKHKVAALSLHDLRSGKDIEIPNVFNAIFSPNNQTLIYSAFDMKSKIGGIYYRDLSVDPNKELIIKSADNVRSLAQQWNKKGSHLAFVLSSVDEDKRFKAEVYIWHAIKNESHKINGIKNSWYVPEQSPLNWTKNGDKLFFRLKPKPGPRLK